MKCWTWSFREDIETILEQAPTDCQRVLFSATMPPPIRELSKRFLRDPQMLTIADADHPRHCAGLL